MKTGKAPLALALAPSGKTLYASCLASNDVWIYRVSP